MKRIKYLQCLLVPWLTACSSLPTPPMRIPFEPYQKGSKIEQTFQIDEENSYHFSLDYPLRKTNYDKEILVLVREALKTPSQLHVQLFLMENQKETIVLDEKIFAEKENGGGAALGKHIKHLLLQKGVYRISIESLAGEPDIAYLLKLKPYIVIAHPQGK